MQVAVFLIGTVNILYQSAALITVAILTFLDTLVKFIQVFNT